MNWISVPPRPQAQSPRPEFGRSALALAVVAACSSGAPSGFSGAPGDSWTFPLVGPLEDGILITPVWIGTAGPYLFALDPDAPISVVDDELVKQAELRRFNGPPRLDESGTQRPRVYAEVVGLEIGSLVIERRDVIVVNSGSFDVAGRRIHGVIGSDVLADSLVFGFDRDRGLGYLTATKSFRPPADAVAIPYELVRGTNPQSAPRRVAVATIANHDPWKLHLDLGATASQLREPLWDSAKLVSRDVQSVAIDEVGTFRRISKASEPVSAVIGVARSDRVAFVPYEDSRWPGVVGSLGLGFFAPFRVWSSTDTRTLYLSPRRNVALASRLSRWETGPIQRCKHPGCVAVRLVDPLADKPLESGRPHPGVVLSITRDDTAGGMGLEVVLESSPPRAELPRLLVNLPEHVDRLIDQLDPAWLGVAVVAIDASPFPRACLGKNGCVDKLAR